MGKSTVDMTEPELRKLMTGAAKAVESAIPTGARFVLLVFDVPVIAQYISNARRADIIKSMRECADRLEAKEDVAR